MFEVSASVWALTDDRAGHNAHTLGLAEALGLEYDEKQLQFNLRAQLPAPLQNASFTSLKPASRDLLSPPWPSIVIASGRRMLPIMAAIKAASPKTKLVQCLWPGQLEPFDVILAPHHDNVPQDSRILRFHGALHRLRPESLKDAALTFHALFENLPKPHYGVLIGGHSKHGKASIANLHHLIDTAEFLVGDGSLIITTSRRTPKGFAQAIRDRLTCDYHLHEWSAASPANPYHAMLAHCDALMVSGDSVSMIAEACASGKPVIIDTQFNSMRDKHARAAQSLIQAGHAVELRADIDIANLTPILLDEMPRIAKEVRARLRLEP